MKWIFLICGIVAGATGAVAAMIYLQVQRRAFEGDQLIFAAKSFYDSKQTVRDGYVAISGTLTGEGLGYPNNTYSIACFQDRKECVLSYVEQIGHYQIGHMEAPTVYPIEKWDAYEIVAADEPGPRRCTKVTITIERRQGTLLWVQEPINQTIPACKDSDTKIYKWTIEDSPGWKRLFGKSN